MRKLTLIFTFCTFLLLLGASVQAQDQPDVEVFQRDAEAYIHWFYDTYDFTDVKTYDFSIQYRLTGGTDWQSVKVGLVNEYVLTGLDPNGNYEFQVVGIATDGTEYVYACDGVNKAPANDDGKKARGGTGALQSGDYYLDIGSFQNIPYSGGRFNFITASVDSGTTGWPYLAVGNFEVFEDGILQTDNFDVIPPSDTNCIRPADIVFIIDNSGSMGGEIGTVRNNAIAFGDSLAALGIDYRLGAVRFGQSLSNGNSLFYGPLTDDANVFRGWIASMGAGGGREPGLQAIINSANYFGFRPGSSRHFVLITDEDSDGGSLSEAIAICNANNIAVHVRAYCPSSPEYCGPSGIAQQTGGTVDGVTAPFWDLMNNLETGICDNYVVRWSPSNDTCDGMQREVVLRVFNGPNSDEDTVYYTPCMAPVITVTPDTRGLELIPQLENVPLVLQAWVVDNVEPFTQSVTLHYRTTGQTAYTPVPMTWLGDSLYTFSVPAVGVQNPGLDYYVTATDGQSTASAPKVDADICPYQIAVLPNELPVILHDTLGPYQPMNIPLTVIAEVIDNTQMLLDVQLFYRRFGELLFSMESMNPAAGDVFDGVIPAHVNVLGGCEYYILARDDFGLTATHGDADFPHQINVGLPLVANIHGCVTVDGLGLEGVYVNLLDDGGTLLEIVTTAPDGCYLLDSIPTGDYTVELEVPIGFIPISDPEVPVTLEGIDQEVNFTLGQVEMSKFRSAWWWKVYLSDLRDDGPRRDYFSVEDVNGWLQEIYDHFYARDDQYAIRIEYVTYADDPARPATFEDICYFLFDVASPVDHQGKYEHRYERFLLTHLLNFVSNRMSQIEVVSADGASASQATTYLTSIYDSGDNDDLMSAYYNMRRIHLQQLIPAGVIPLTTPNVMYRPTDLDGMLPTTLSLAQNYPNPFNPVTVIEFALPQEADVTIEVYNISGQKVSTVVDEHMDAGHHYVEWDGALFASGVYLYRLTTDDFSETKKMILLK